MQHMFRPKGTVINSLEAQDSKKTFEAPNPKEQPPFPQPEQNTKTLFDTAGATTNNSKMDDVQFLRQIGANAAADILDPPQPKEQPLSLIHI